MSVTDRERTLKDLMISSMDGDEKSYQLFLSEINSIATAYLVKRCGHLGKDRIEDLVQEVLMSIHQKRSSYRRDLPILPWIYTITKHKLIDELRSEKRKKKNLEAMYEREVTQIGYEKNDEIELDILISGITDKQKQILILSKVEEVPLAEIAIQFKMSLSAIKVTIHRALKSMRR